MFTLESQTRLTLSLTHIILCFFHRHVWVCSFVISFLFLIVYLLVSCLLSTSSLHLFSQNVLFTFSSSCSSQSTYHFVMTVRLELWPVWSTKKRNTYTCMCRCAFICHGGVCYCVNRAAIHQLAVKCLCSLGLVYFCVTHRNLCGVSSAEQRIVGQRSQKSILQNTT